MVGSRACAVANAMSHRIVSLVRSQVCIVQLLQMYVTGTIQPAQLTCTIHHCWHTLLLISGQRLALVQHARALRFQGSDLAAIASFAACIAASRLHSICSFSEWRRSGQSASEAV